MKTAIQNLYGMDDHIGFLENWQDAVVVWSFVAVTVFVTWRILVSKPRE